MAEKEFLWYNNCKLKFAAHNFGEKEMEKKFFVETEQFNTNVVNNFDTTNPLQITNDTLVNDFLNKTVSLESLIEKEIYNILEDFKILFAYHSNKINRGYDYLIDVLGADHHGYINRMKSALMMKGYKKETLEVPLIQVVRLMDKGVEVKMSKRTGNAITLKELCGEVGVDAVRYFFVARSNTSHLDFDYALAKSKTNDNPVYYAMYAHARLHNVLELGKGMKVDYSGKLLKEKSELDILKTLQEFPRIVEIIAKSHEVHKLTIFIHSLATLIHSFYNECRIVNKENLELTANRLGLVEASKIVLSNALSLIGVNAPNKM